MYKNGYTYIGDKANSIPNPFIGSKHACFGNDNVELFSRSKIYNKLLRENGKIKIAPS